MPTTTDVKGRYEGAPPAVEFDPDGRRVRLIKKFAYVDCRDNRWEVPSEAIIDGASIPQPLWSLLGGPFEGRYRNASIIHDWFCDRRIRPWEQVHRVFYEAMLTSGVSKARAKLMYAGVYWGGPRWSLTVVQNNNLGNTGDINIPLPAAPTSFRAPDGKGTFAITRPPGRVNPPAYQAITRPRRNAKPKTYRYELNNSDLRAMQKALEADDLDLTEIDSMVNNKLKTRKRS